MTQEENNTQCVPFEPLVKPLFVSMIQTQEQPQSKTEFLMQALTIVLSDTSSAEQLLTKEIVQTLGKTPSDDELVEVINFLLSIEEFDNFVNAFITQYPKNFLK